MKQSEDDSVRYYIYVDENVSGPLVIEELAALVQQEKITADTLVACEGDEAYVPLRYSKLTPVLFPGLATNQPGTEGRPKLSRDDDVRYYTCIEESVGGPYTIEGLESLVYLKKITSDTYVAREGAEEYILLRDSELQPILFPGLLTQQDSTPDVWAPPGQENDPAQINRKRFRTTTAKFENVNAKAGNLPKIDVYDILDEIRETEKMSGLDLPRADRFRISKRSLDFWFMIIVGNAVILGAAIIMQSTMSLVFGIGCSALYTFGLLWSMYGVMDRY